MLEFLYSPWGLIVLGVIGVVLGGLAAVWWSLRQPDPNPKGGFKAQSGLVVTVLALTLAFFQVPSISVDLTTIFTYASQIVTMMMPIVGVGAGISFGFALVAYIIRLFRQVF